MIARCFAGILLGLPLSIALIACAIWAWPGSSESVVMPFLILFFPLWIGVMAASFLFRSGARAWAWLAVADVGAFALLWALKHTMPGL
ncbi:hypothetical protein EC912_106162 [Luteibacter rhizovicinus]|uniref:Transmembrane lipoprotein n=1 Tax=Luteibacter rhizovicinus TaxID=242606 RepID=A0A4R3YPI1_9GAMM|nr:hypothetical protein [Luteibacter rhizovicinus]TCV92823.1 hypothetical protein EC912_106162 [Luteibacter rhizovicinus]